jgi:hypothetical protein
MSTFHSALAAGPLRARRVAAALGLCLSLAGCTDPYLPDVIRTPDSFLVVDGFINPQGVTTIKLSRTYAIAAQSAPPVETRATVYIEDETGGRFVLRESSVKGTYLSDYLTLNGARKFRLHLSTAARQEYASDYVPVKITPAIDDVAWRLENDAVRVYASTHDATGRTQYYRWETDETWEIHPIDSPTYEYTNGAMRLITVPYPATCWGNAHSSTVQLAKTTALTQDVVSDAPLRQLAANSERLYARYSVLVQQYALTKEEYEYWELLRKNTESIGSLFDPQPSQLTGNVHCLTDANEAALGFVGAHTLAEKRIFIARTDLPSGRRVLNGYENCVPPDTVFLYSPSPPPPIAVVLEGAFGGGDLVPINITFSRRRGAGYTAKVRDCVDCRTRGTAVKPPFWP